MQIMKDNDLKVEHVTKLYNNFRLEASFDIKHGEFVTVVGPSGCGKTTLLSLICGLIQPDSGTIHLRGREIDSLNIWERNIGMVFQDYALFPNMDIENNIGYGMKMRNLSRQAVRDGVSELMHAFEIESLKGRMPDSLSGGEKQRVALARALAVTPDLLLLDEPLSAIDAALRISLRNEIRMVQRKFGITTLYVTHDQDEALAVSDRVLIMNKGALVQTGSPEDIYRRPNSLFSAEFFGRSTLIPVKSGNKTAAPCWFEPGNTKSRLYRADEIEEGKNDGYLHFRPEAAVLLTEDNPGDRANILSNVQILNSEFCGSGYYIHGLWDSVPVTLFSRSPVATGTAISVYIPREELWLIRDRDISPRTS